jgi:uncharacterized protein (DUF1697 family)
MADLRGVVESLGYGDVRTLLNSGNVVFSCPGKAPGDAAARIEKALAEELGVSARVTVLTADEIADAIASNPLEAVADNPSRLLLAVLQSTADRAKLEPLLKQDWGDEALALGKRVAYVWCANGINTSALMEAVGRALGDAVTARNWATARKLCTLAQDSN